MKYTTFALLTISIMFSENVSAQQKESKDKPTLNESKECIDQLNICNEAWKVKTKNYQACKELCHSAMLKCKPTHISATEDKDTSFERAKRHRLDCVNGLQKAKTSSSSPKK